jgi:hypothetical protein
VLFDIAQPNAEIIRQTEEHCRAAPGFKSAEARRAEMREMMQAAG